MNQARIVVLLSLFLEIYSFPNEFQLCNFTDQNFVTIFHMHFGNVTSLNIVLIKNKFKGNIDDFSTEFMKILMPQRPVNIYNFELNKNNNDFIKINYIHNQIQNPQVQKNENIRDYNKGYILISWDEDLHILTEDLERFLKLRSTCMVLLISLEPPNEKKIEFILRHLWKNYGITNIIFATPCTTTKSYFKFDRFAQEETSGKVLHFNSNTTKLIPKLFRNTLKDLKGYPVPISLFIRIPTVIKPIPKPLRGTKIYDILQKSGGFGGQDGMVLANLAEYLNFNPLIKIPPAEYEYGYELPNGTYLGSLADVINKNVVISINGRFINDYGTDKIEFTTSVSNDLLCIIVPSAEKVPQWLKIFKCFTIEAWMGIFGIYLITTLCWFSIKPINFKKNIKNKKTCSSAFEVYSIFVSASVRLPSLDSQRVFFASCMFFGIIITNTFQGSLIKSYTTTSYFTNINSLQQFDDSGLKIEINSKSLSDTFVGDNNLGRRLRKKIMIVKEANLMQRVAYKRDVAGLERNADAKMRIKAEFTTYDGFEMLHIVKECPRSYHISYIVSKGSPYLPIFDHAIKLFKESGLLKKWTSDTLDGFVLESRKNRQLGSSGNKAFTLYDMQTAFYLLAVGLAISLIIFILELITDCNLWGK